MKTNIAAALGIGVATLTTATFLLGMKVSSNDAKLFQAFDQNRAALLAGACGSNAELLQNPRTYAYSCVHTNRDGTMIMREISDAPLLAARR